MVMSASVIPTNEQTAEANNGPLIIPENLLASQSVIPPYWTANPGVASTDVSDSVGNGRRAIDYALDTPFFTSDASSQFHYVHFQINASEADTFILKMSAISGTYNITVELADNSSYTGSITVAAWTNITNTNRLVQSGLPTSAAPSTYTHRLSGVTHGRITFEKIGGSAAPPPAIGEIVLGRRRGLSHAIQSGSDDKPRGVSFAEVVTAGRKRFRYVHAAGYEDHDASYKLGEVSILGMNDLATLREVQERSNFGAQAVWARFRTSSNWVFGYLDGAIDLPLESGQFTEREWSYSFFEQPPFASKET